jgi:predicted DNA-binding protein
MTDQYYKGCLVDTLTLKIPGVIKEKLKTYSKRKGISKSEIVRNALLDYFDRDALEKQGTFYDLAQDLAGSVNGAPDLSTNKEYLSGYGQ